MTYTILSAKYANADHTAAVIETQEAAAVAISQADTPELWTELQTSGVAIVEYAQTVSADPTDYPLTMRQLRLALLTLGSKPVDFVASVINNITDPTQKAEATIWYEETVDGISWGHPETQFLISASGLTSDQAKALWLQAAAL